MARRKYKQWDKSKYRIVGSLHRLKGSVMVYKVGKRTKYKDDANQVWVKAFDKWWKFPEEIEY